MDVKTALTCIIDGEITKKIQEIRKQHDPAFVRWPPHFNIGCFPFISEINMSNHLNTIQSICAKYSKIKLSLRNLNMFPSNKKSNGTLFLCVNGATQTDTDNLYAMVTEICNIFNIKCDDFHPHITIGRFSVNDDMQKHYTMYSKIFSEPYIFELNGLTFISRNDDTPFAAKYFFPFGNNEFIKFNNVRQNVQKTTDYYASVASINGYSMINLKSNSIIRSKTKVCNILVIDNSGSMGQNTKLATRIIGKGLFNMKNDQIELVSGKVIIFSDLAEILSENIKSGHDIDTLKFPEQGNTNITNAIEIAVATILNASQPDVHYVLTFLSDGQHNLGNPLTKEYLNKLRSKLNDDNIKLTVNIVGISRYSNTTLGMLIKTELETVTLNSLESIYYANDTNEMNTVLKKLVNGCETGLGCGNIVELSVNGGLFVINMSDKYSMVVGDKLSSILIKNTDDNLSLMFNNMNVDMEERSLSYDDIEFVIDSMIPKLSQMLIANGQSKIKNQLSMLNNLIDISEKLLINVSDKTDPIIKGLTPKKRLEIIKKSKMAKVRSTELRNKLKLLEVTTANDSKSQADYLTGINKKYAGKAVVRAGTIDTTPREIFDHVQNIKKQLKDTLKLDDIIYKNYNPDKIDESILSINNAYDQMVEWLNFPDNYDPTELSDIHSFLEAVGFFGYSVKFFHNSAVQMDPFQTTCMDIQPCPVDSSSILFSNKMHYDIKDFAKNVITDCLVLVNPMAPNSSLLLMKSKIYEYLASVTLCRDLYMYNPKMTFSMHAHSLVESVNKYFLTGSEKYLDLALKIVYSIRKYWGGKNVKIDLFKRWFVEWSTITQAEADDCDHPVQLLLMLCAYDLNELKIEYDNVQIPLVNLINELIARKMKSILNGISEDTKEKAISILQNMFGINETNSPNPHPDPLVSEPNLESIIEQCQRYSDINVNSNDLKMMGLKNTDGLSENDFGDIVNNIVMKYVKTFYFGIALQKFYKMSNVREFDKMMEHGNYDICINSIKNEFEHIKTKQLHEILNTNIHVYKTMFCQGTMYHTSALRNNVVEHNVLDNETFAYIIVALRLKVYEKLMIPKKEKYNAMIGDHTYACALRATPEQFDAMIHGHVHSGSKDFFWALVAASVNDKEKQNIFYRKSNMTGGWWHKNKMFSK